MKILSIDTSCDETSVAVTSDLRVLSHIEYSQILMHKKWGGVVPVIAKRAHQENIDFVVNTAIEKSKIDKRELDAIAVTIGPGLAIALEVGIQKAKDMANELGIPLIPINHMEGHLYSAFVQNRNGNPKMDFDFPYLGVLISGGHTELVVLKKHLSYEILGSTRDDAAGEALDKAARIIGFGYPGGPVIERLASQVNNADKYKFPQPMIGSKNLEFSFSGLKTSFLYKVKSMDNKEIKKELCYLASSFQEAIFQTIMKKTKQAIVKTGIKKVLIGGGVSVNLRLRSIMRKMVSEKEGQIFFPSFKYLNFDNAAMIGIVAYIKIKNDFKCGSLKSIDRVPRLSLLQSIK